MPTINDLGQKVKAKYPGQYDDMDDAEVGRRVKEKYPGAYDDFTDAVAPAAPTASQSGGALGVAKNLGIGALKFAGEAVSGASALGEKILQAPQKALGIQTRTPLGQQLIDKGTFEAEGTAQKVGKGGAEIASYLIPGAVPVKAAGALSKATGVAKATGLLGKAGRLGIRAATEAAVVGGQTAIQSGGDVERTKSAALLGGASVPVLGAAGKVLGGAGRVAREALGRTTGAGEAALKEAYTNPNVIKYARQGADAVTSLQEQALEGAQRGLGNMVKKRGEEYVKALEKIKADPLLLREITQNAINFGREALENASVKVGKKGLLTARSFRDSAIEQGKNSVQKAYRVLSTWKDHTPAGLDRLKKKLGQFVTATKNTTDGSYAAIKAMRNAVDDGLKANVHGYSEMTKKYREASDIIDEIERALSLKDSTAKETAVRKLMSTMRQNNEMRLDFLKMLGAKGSGDVIGKIAGSTLATATPRGLAGAIGATGLPSIGAFGVGNIPGLLLYFAASSPRLVGEAISILGKSKGKLPTAEMKKALNALIIQAQRESEDGQNDTGQ